MCVLAFAWRAHPRWQLVLAGNRDEYHARPAGPLTRWPGAGGILAGQDLQSGGTWLGVAEAGRLAVVTNVRNVAGPAPGLPSRGALVTDVLAGTGRFADAEAIDPAGFNPFNLIAADRQRALFLSNRPVVTRQAMAAGLYGLSNGMLDEPWPKTERIRQMLAGWIDGAADNPALLLEDLREDRLPGGEPRRPGMPLEPALSPVFIRDPLYGTRCSTVVAIDGEGRGMIVERRYTPEGEPSGETKLAFSWPG